MSIVEQSPINSVEDDAEAELSVEEHVFKYGPFPDSYLLTEPEYQHFWSADRSGLVGYIQDGKHLHLVGGLVTAPENEEKLLAEFCEWVDQQKLHPSFFSIPASQLELFRKYGYQATKFGEENKLSLPGHKWSGKKYSWIRRQVSFVERAEIVSREIDLETISISDRKKLFDKLQTINTEQLSGRVLKHEIGLLEGKLYPDHFYRRRLFVAHPENDPDNIQAFVACTPMRNGTGWATEMYRASNDSVRGVVPFLIVKLADQLQAEGCEELSLCMVPGIHTGEKHPGDCGRTRFFLSLWEKRMNFLFNVQGLHHFKSRFRPEYESVFLCVRPKITLGSTFSFVKCVGVFKLDWRNWLRLSKRSA